MSATSYALQRLSATLLAPLVLIHIIGMIIAIQGGISAEEILGRTRGSWLWGGFYGLFVIAAAIHISVGLGNILAEWTSMSRGLIAGLAHGYAMLALILGLRAVYAVVLA
jgi:fumarate reductase subunit C